MTATTETKKTRPTVRPALPEAHADVAMIDMNDFAALARMSKSWLHDEVRAGRAPQPLRFGPRCTRWRLVDVRSYLITRAELGAADTQAAALLTSRAKKASDAARAKRAAAPSEQ